MSLSDSKTGYELAVAAYKRKTSLFRYCILGLAIFAASSELLQWESSLTTVFIVALILTVSSYVILRRRLWKKLEIEHGLIND